MILATWLSGCATQVGLGALVSEGKADELTAMEKYEGERLIVSGVVAGDVRNFSRNRVIFENCSLQ